MPFKKNNAKGSPHSRNVKKLFVGRANELHFFRKHILEPEDPRHNLLSIAGQGGVGKSTLLIRYITEAQSPNFKDYCLVAIVDERQLTPASIMEKFAEQFQAAGHPLKKFEEALTHYKDALRRIQARYQDQQEVMIREAVDIAGTIIEDVPLGGAIHKGANTFTELILDKRRTSQFLKDATHLEDPVGDLTKAFVKDLNQLADSLVTSSVQWSRRQRRIILFFDTFEQLAGEVVPWLLDYLLEQDVSANIVFVTAGRDLILDALAYEQKRWLPYLDNDDLYLMLLNPFTEEETRTLCASFPSQKS